MYVCLCKGLTESDVRRAAQSCELDPDSLVKKLGLDHEDCCGRCLRNIHQLITIASASPAPQTVSRESDRAAR